MESTLFLPKVSKYFYVNQFNLAVEETFFGIDNK